MYDVGVLQAAEAEGGAIGGACPVVANSEPKSLTRSESQRKSYAGGGTRQYSLPAEGCTDIATSYNEVVVIGHRGACGRFPEHTQKGYHEAYSLPVSLSHSLPTDPRAVSGGAGWG